MFPGHESKGISMFPHLSSPRGLDVALRGVYPADLS